MAMRVKKAVPGSLLRGVLSGGVVLLLLAVMAAGTALAKQVDAPTTKQDATWGKVYRVTKDIKAPVLVYSVEPKYPEAASAKHEAKVTCVVGMIVDGQGKLHDIHMVRSAGKDFDDSAMQAVAQYKFKPALRFGKPVAVKVNIEVVFRKY